MMLYSHYLLPILISSINLSLFGYVIYLVYTLYTNIHLEFSNLEQTILDYQKALSTYLKNK